MKHHPFADLFPMMNDAEFDALCVDIKTNGLRERIVTYYDKILDGRNRDAACRKMGVQPLYTVYPGNDALGFVISKNLLRRHLTDSQRADIAAKLVENGRKPVLQTNGLSAQKPDVALSVASAAASLNVSKRAVERAGVVRAKGSPELIAEVASGKKKLMTAFAEVSPPKVKIGESDAAYKKIVDLLDKLSVADLTRLSIELSDRLPIDET